MKKSIFESLKFFCAAILCLCLSAFATPACAALPSGYTELEYIESTGTQIIVTDFVPTWEDTIEADYELTNLSATGDKFLIGAQPTDVQGSGFWVETYGEANSWYVRYGSNKSATTFFKSSQTSGTFILSKSSFVVNGTRILTPTADVQPTLPMSIFGRLGLNGGVTGAFVRFSNIRVKRSNVLTHNFVPAKDSSGKIGMYDTVNNRFYTNAGTGEFIAGDPVVAANGACYDYTSATGTGVQNGIPTPDNPIEPTFYKQGNMVLRKVGDYADSYDASTGKITRRVGVKVLDGTETGWYAWNNKFRLTNVFQSIPSATSINSHFINGYNNVGGAGIVSNGVDYAVNYPTIQTVDAWKQFLADQYAAGTPVMLYYPLAEETTEDWTETSYCETPIKIATTKYNETAFGPLNTALQNAISVVDTVVTQTITQAASIATLQAQKQTRPADDPSDANNAENCPAGKKCLLVTDTSGIPHWYEIFDPIHEWYEAWVTAGRPAVKGTKTDGKWTFYNAFYRGDKTWRKTYIDGSTSTYDRPFAHATRCTSPNYNGETPNASPCYSEIGMFKTLSDGEWAEVYTSDDGTNSPVGVVYGTSKCTSVGGPTNYANGGTPLSKLSAADQAKWAELPAPVGQAEREGYERESFKQCWCKVEGVGVPGADGNHANGSIYPVGASSWVFNYTYGSAANCASRCAYDCASGVRDSASFRSAVFGGLE